MKTKPSRMERALELAARRLAFQIGCGASLGCIDNRIKCGSPSCTKRIKNTLLKLASKPNTKGGKVICRSYVSTVQVNQ